MLDQTTTARFWAKVAKGDGCWEWTAARFKSGYGQFYLDRTMKYAHRTSWEMHFGPIPAGLFICHHCDNRGCVRPDHLFMGTAADNTADMRAKDRQFKGPWVGASGYSIAAEKVRRGEERAHKLTAAQVAEIRARYAAGGVRHKDLAGEYGVHKSTISKLTLGNRWQHLLHAEAQG